MSPKRVMTICRCERYCGWSCPTGFSGPGCASAVTDIPTLPLRDASIVRCSLPTNRSVGEQSADHSSPAPGGQRVRRHIYGGARVVIDATSSPPLAGGRVRILREARLLFTAQGYAAVSMQLIADAAGVNKATLYHHFDDKEDLFVSVMAEEFARLAAGLREVFAAGGSLRDQLTRFAVHIFSSHKSDFGRLAEDLDEHVSEKWRTELMTRCAPPWEHIRLTLERAVATHEVSDLDPEWLAHLFFVMVGSQI